jgi:hypothetical protein
MWAMPRTPLTLPEGAHGIRYCGQQRQGELISQEVFDDRLEVYIAALRCHLAAQNAQSQVRPGPPYLRRSLPH